MRKFCMLMAVVLLAGCSRPQPPVGRWEGGAERGGVLVAARVEILANGAVKISAPDITNAMGPRDDIMQMQARLAADLVNGWADVPARRFDFDGRVFRKPGGVAPQMMWDKDTGQIILQLYIGANPALPVVLRPVVVFHDDPFANG